MISIENLIKYFDSTLAVDIDKLDINSGEIFGLVGNNGAGKTTLLRLMLDLLKPDKGKIFSNELLVFQSEHWKKYTGSYLDNNFLIEFLKPEEYFDFIGFLYALDRDELRKRLAEFDPFMNGEVIGNNKYIRTLSSGNKQKVGIIGALVSLPKVLILDEPFNYLDPSSQMILKQILKDLNSNYGTTIIISSHNLSHISDICTRIGLMGKGKIIMENINTHDNMLEIEEYFKSQINH